jgi:hypothetical protein
VIREISSALILTLLLSGIAFSSETSAESVDFLKTQVAIIKGEMPSTQIQSDGSPPKCGTPVFLAAYTMAQRSGNQILESLQARPSPDSLPYSLASDNFIIHYSLTGGNAPYQVNIDINPEDGVPDYVNRVSETFEHVWQIEIDSLGYTPPPSDRGRGGDDRYDIYLENLGFGYFGFTNPEETVQVYRAYSFIELENDFQESPTYRSNPIAAVQVTAAHEFFHAVQFGYDAYEFDYDDPDNPTTYKPWWLEASSTWMEDIVYDDVNDYLGYLHFFYKYIWMSLTTFSYGGDVRAFHPYACCVWPIYMTEKYDDPNIMREIWEDCGAVQGYNTLTATDAALRERGSNIGEAFQEFSVWNFHAGEFADQNRFYSEGSSFPEPETTLFINDLQNHSQVNIPDTIKFPEQYATNFIIIEPSSQLDGGVQVQFDGQIFSGQNWHGALLGYENIASEWRDMGLEPTSGDGADSWPGWNFFRDIVLIPTVTGFNRNPNRFTYAATISYDPGLISGDSLLFYVSDPWPSPFLLSSAEPVSISYSLDRRYHQNDVVLSIFDVSGSLIREVKALYTGPGKHSDGLLWDGKNESGEKVASGVYIYLLSAGNKSGTGKIAVVNDSH